MLFIHLAGEHSVIEACMKARQDHFMPVDLLDSQFADLELPTVDEDSITVDVDQSLESIVTKVIQKLEEQKI